MCCAVPVKYKLISRTGRLYAQTCFHHLEIPDFATYSEFSESMLAAIVAVDSVGMEEDMGSNEGDFDYATASGAADQEPTGDVGEEEVSVSTRDAGAPNPLLTEEEEEEEDGSTASS